MNSLVINFEFEDLKLQYLTLREIILYSLINFLEIIAENFINSFELFEIIVSIGDFDDLVFIIIIAKVIMGSA